MNPRTMKSGNSLKSASCKPVRGSVAGGHQFKGGAVLRRCRGICPKGTCQEIGQQVPEARGTGAYASLVKKSSLAPALSCTGDFYFAFEQVACGWRTEAAGIRDAGKTGGGGEPGLRSKGGCDGFVNHPVGGAGRDLRERVGAGDNQAVSEVIAMFNDTAAGPTSDVGAPGVEPLCGIVTAEVAEGNPRAIPTVESQEGAVGGFKQHLIKGHVVEAVERGRVCEQGQLWEKHPSKIIGTG